MLNLWHQNLALLEQNGEKMSKPEKSTVTYPWAGLRVLVADDVLVNADILRNMLVSFGLVVDVAYRGDEALERLMGQQMSTGGYALAFLDIYMPGISGLDAVARFRASSVPNAKTLPIVGMSSDAEPLLVERAHASGMDVLLLKPVVRKMLERVLANILKVSEPLSRYSPSTEARLVFLESESRSTFTLSRTLLGAKRLMESVFDAIPFPISLKSSADSRYVRINKAFAENLGQDRLSVIGCTAADLFPNANVQIAAEHDRQTLVAGTPLTFEERVRVGNEIHDVRKTQSVVEDEDGRRYIVSFVENVTKAPDPDKVLADRIKALGRDLRAPLQAMADVVELLRQDGKATTRRTCTKILAGALDDIRRQLKTATTVRRAKGGQA